MKTKTGWEVEESDLLKNWIQIFCAFRQSQYFKDFHNDELRELSFEETKMFYNSLHAMMDSEEVFENL